MNTPAVTVILPIRNEAAYIECGLKAIADQDFLESVEILISDGMSTDETRRIIHDFSDRHPQLQIQILDNPDHIVPTGFNIALRQAKGEIIIRVDGHTIIAPDYVRQCVDALHRTNADNVGGKMNAIGVTLFGEATALATSSPFGIGGGRFHYSDKEEWVDTVYMGAWPRRVFEKIGLFDEELVRDQDDEFNYRLRENGGRILLSPAIKSEYTVRSSPKALWKQYYQYGFWKVRVLQKHPRQMRLRQFVPPLLVASLSLSLLMLFIPYIPHPFSLIPFSLIMGFYMLANLCASLMTAARRGWEYIFLLPLIYAILHLSYGIGLLAGLLKFVNRWGDKKGKTPVFDKKIVRAT